MRVGVVLVVIVVALLAACDRAADSPGPSEAGAADQGDRQRIVAEVNGAPIRAGQVAEIRLADRLLTAAVPAAGSAAGQESPWRRALDLAIDSELLYQAARKRGLTVADDAIDEQLAVARSQFADEEEFREHLRTSGLTAEALRERVRRRLLIRAYVDTFAPGATAADAEARQIYEAERERFVEPEQVRAAQILVRLRPDDPPERREQARRTIEEAHRRAVAGEEFAALAREYSESPLAARGGDLGFLARGRMLPEFDSVVFATPVGGITPVFETPHGFNVAKVLDRRPAQARPFEEVKSGLLMVLEQQRRSEALHEHLVELRRRATIRVLDDSPVGGD